MIELIVNYIQSIIIIDITRANCELLQHNQPIPNCELFQCNCLASLIGCQHKPAHDTHDNARTRWANNLRSAPIQQLDWSCLQTHNTHEKKPTQPPRMQSITCASWIPDTDVDTLFVNMFMYVPVCGNSVRVCACWSRVRACCTQYMLYIVVDFEYRLISQQLTGKRIGAAHFIMWSL